MSTTESKLQEIEEGLIIPHKIVIIGDSAVGKTWLLASLRSPDDTDLASMNLPQSLETFQTKIDRYGTTWHLNYWDTAGSPVFDRIRPLYYPQLDCCIITFSLVSPISYKNITEKWYPEFKHHCSGRRLILIGTQLDGIEKTNKDLIISCKDGLKLKKQITAGRYIECSSVTKEAYVVQNGKERELLHINYENMKTLIFEILNSLLPQDLINIIWNYRYQLENQLDIISKEIIGYAEECSNMQVLAHRRAFANRHKCILQ